MLSLRLSRLISHRDGDKAGPHFLSWFPHTVTVLQAFRACPCRCEVGGGVGEETPPSQLWPHLRTPGGGGGSLGAPGAQDMGSEVG